VDRTALGVGTLTGLRKVACDADASQSRTERRAVQKEAPIVVKHVGHDNHHVRLPVAMISDPCSAGRFWRERSSRRARQPPELTAERWRIDLPLLWTAQQGPRAEAIFTLPTDVESSACLQIGRNRPAQLGSLCISLRHLIVSTIRRTNLLKGDMQVPRINEDEGEASDRRPSARARVECHRLHDNPEAMSRPSWWQGG
jgi:hypothetical protein